MLLDHLQLSNSSHLQSFINLFLKSIETQVLHNDAMIHYDSGIFYP